MVQLTEEEFQLIYDAMYYGADPESPMIHVNTLLDLEATAWELVKNIKPTNQPSEDPLRMAYELYPQRSYTAVPLDELP